MSILAYILSGLSLLMSVVFLVRSPKPPLGFIVAFIKLTAGALSPYWAIVGLLGVVIGCVYQALWAVPMGLFGMGMMISYIWRCTRDHQGFEVAFGSGWPNQISPELARHMLQKRWTWFSRLNTFRKVSCSKNIPFWTIPSTDRQLYCDLWFPDDGKTTGLTFIYLHGGAWAVSDKDVGTKPFFRHLVAQGHIVMDVAYRLIPEADIYGMVGDTKRAVAWIKANADHYGVNPKKVVLGGGSSGAHIALLAAYTPQLPELTPEDVKAADLSVCGVISYYGNTDLVAGHEVFGVRDFSTKIPSLPIGTRIDPKKAFNYAGRLDILLSGHPEEVPAMYRLASPTTHVNPSSPPTLLIQGNDDFLIPVDCTYKHYLKLVESGVAAINIVFPWTDHAFDLLFQQTSPPFQSALYDVNRFLALLANND